MCTSAALLGTLKPRIRTVQLPARTEPTTFTRSNTPATETLDPRTTPFGSTTSRSTSLCGSGCSGHQIATLSWPEFCLMMSGSDRVSPFITGVTADCQVLGALGSLMTPAPEGLLTGGAVALPLKLVPAAVRN